QWNGEELRREARDLHEHPKSTIGWYCNAISYAVIAMRTMAREQVVSAERLRSFATAVLRTVGMPDDDADVVADAMVWADLRDLPMHGVSGKLPQCVRRIRSGVTAAKNSWEPVSENASTVV